MNKYIRNAYIAFSNNLSSNVRTDYRKVVLLANYGRGYLCNPKYIAEALNRLYPNKYDLVLLTNHIDTTLPDYIRQVKYRSISGQRELATARFWIDNCRGPKYINKREDQIYIQTWHGCVSPKRIEADAEEHLDPNYVRNAKLDGSITDLMFANNDLYANVYRKAFWYDGPVLRCGNPRNRPLILGDDKAVEKVRKRLGIPADTAIWLYAPTFRADWSMDQYKFDFDRFNAALESRFNRKYTFVYRLHPNIASLERPAFFEDRIDATDYPDVQELLVATDICVSDYSSILEDFALTGRPGFVYAPDYDSYRSDRGFYYSLDDRPFPVALNESDLIAIGRHFNQDIYQKDLRHFFEMIGLSDDGLGDEYIAKLMDALSITGTTVGDLVGR